MGYPQFAWENRRFLAFGLVTAFFSSFGQTYFIAVFGPAIRAEFGLSHGAFGGYYATGTLASAALLVWAGRLIDRIDLCRFSVGLAALVAGACALMALVPAAPLLALALFALRFTGQGLMSHTAITSMARYFDAGRGRAIATAMLGFPAGVAVFPLFGVALTDAFGWRQAWALLALVLAVGLGPLMLWLLHGHEQRHRRYLDSLSGGNDAGPAGTDRTERRQWTRAEVLRDPRFYMLGLAAMASSFIVTGFFFHQSVLAASKGWSAAWMASAFVGYSVGSIAGALSAGPLIDRLGATRMMPFFLLPLAAACLLVAVADHPWIAVPFTVLLGLTGGSGQTLNGALWPELYGVVHIGAIRALVMSLGVIASALSPVMLGWLIDWQIPIEAISLGCLGYALVGSGLIVAALARRPAPVPVR